VNFDQISIASISKDSEVIGLIIPSIGSIKIPTKLLGGISDTGFWHYDISSKGTGWGWSRSHKLHIFYNIPLHNRPISLVTQFWMTARWSSDILLVDMLVPACRSRKTAMFAIEKQQFICNSWFATSAQWCSCTMPIKVWDKLDRNIFDKSGRLVSSRNINV
jgi:hypothetical protein